MCVCVSVGVCLYDGKKELEHTHLDMGDQLHVCPGFKPQYRIMPNACVREHIKYSGSSKLILAHL